MTKELTDTNYDDKSSRRRRGQLVREKRVVGAGVRTRETREECRKLWRFRSCSSLTRSSTSLSWRRGRSPWTRLLRRPQRFQLQLFDKVIDVPVVLVVQVPRVQVVEETVEIPQLQLVEKIVVIPEALTVQGAQTASSHRIYTTQVRHGTCFGSSSSCCGVCTTRSRVEYVVPAPAVTYAHVAAAPIIEYVASSTPTVAYASPVTTMTAAPTVFHTPTEVRQRVAHVLNCSVIECNGYSERRLSST